MSHKKHYSQSNEPKRASKSSANTFLISIGVMIAVLLGIVVYAGMSSGATSQVQADNQVQVLVPENNYDWGTIDYGGGIVSKSFVIKNTGSSTLKLYGVETSCMCTTAQLVIGDEKSRKFGMHEKSNSVYEVMPGEMAELMAEFDPAFHGPSGIGPIDRTVTVNTNDASQPQLSFRVTANVVKK